MLWLLTLGPAWAGEDMFPFEAYELDNGLEVILVPDASTPLVDVTLTYHVGSADEAKDQHGWTHFVEHLMFTGTPTVPDIFELLGPYGATQNATTNDDRANFYVTLPGEHLPLALWAEADRMAHLAGALEERDLTNQRAVIENEDRRTAAGRQDFELLRAAVFGSDHPYGHTVMGDLDAVRGASVEEIRTYLRRWYGPANATLLVAGAFRPEEARQLIDASFGRVPVGDARRRRVAPAPVRIQETRTERHTASVATPTVYLAWPSPPSFAPGDAELNLIAAVLEARLTEHLVSESLATRVSAYQATSQRASMFVAMATGAPGADPDALGRALADAVWDLLKDHPPTEHEVRDARAGIELILYEALQAVGSRARTLSMYAIHTGEADALQRDIDRHLQPTAEQIVREAWKTLSAPHVELQIVPEDG